MSSLPSVNWDLDPVFVAIPQTAVIVVAGAIALYSFFQGARTKGGDHTTTGILFAALALIAWKWMDHGLELRYYSMLFVGVFLGGYALLKWQIVRGGGPADDAGDFIVYGVLGVLLGARFGHVIFYDYKKALEDPAWILKIWTGGLASHGAVMGLILAMFLFTRRRGIPFFEGADRFSFSAALGAGLVRLGNLLNSEIVGRVVPDQSWGFRFMRYVEDSHSDPRPLRYPTQIAEMLLGFGILGVLYLFDKQMKGEKRPRGALISMFFVLYFTGRFFVEFWKEFEGNGGMPLGLPITMGQLLSLPGVLIGVIGLIISFKKKIPVGWPSGRLAQEEEDEEEREKRRRRRRKKRRQERAAAAAAIAAGAAAEGSEAGSTPHTEKPEPSSADDEEDDDDEAPESEPSEDDEDAEESEPDNDSTEASEDEDEEPSEDDEETDEDDAPKKDVDPDVADEFDDKGSLKKRRD
ncbi:MAG TPA: prolipoprotein diacylglyceryl transferase [Polyangiaceae bacterium]|nr:prolipoprotein diacylglyceryl transferase [Polyangiaceae bacterium]